MTREGVLAGALDGVRVIDLSRVLGGPYCSQALSDHGADVIKVEPPQGDETRDWGPPFAGGMSAYFAGVNRNKRSIAIDIGGAEGKEILFRLLSTADVLLENFKPGSLERWGLGYGAVLKPRFPRLVHCTITGFGASGPMGGFPGYDLMVQAWSGMVSVNGTAESGPLRLGLPLIDMASGLNAALGIALALRARELNGEGQSIEVTLYDTALSFLHPHTASHLMSGASAGLTGNAHPSIAPYGLHRTGGAAIFIGAGNDGQFARLCRLIGRPDLIEDERFRKNKDRVAHRAALTVIIEAQIAAEDGAALAMLLMQNGVPAGAVQSVGQAVSHPHTAARGMIVEIDGYRAVGSPVKLSATPPAAKFRPPAFAEHAEEILRELGYNEDEIAALRASGAAPRVRSGQG